MNKQLVHKQNNPLHSWFRDMNHLMEKFGRDLSFDTDKEGIRFPKVEIKETESGYNLKAEIPGMEEKDLKLTLKDNNLVIEGERKTERKEEDKSHYFSEFTYGNFYRSIPFDEDVDDNNVNATYKNGILQIELKKLPSSSQKQKRITIKH